MARRFSTDNYLNYTAASVYQLGTWTVAAWTLLESAPVSSATIVAHSYTPGNNLPVALGSGLPQTNLTKMQVGYYDAGSVWSTIVDPNPYIVGKWEHWVGTCAGTSLKLYRNGVLVVSGTGGTHTTTSLQDWRIGRRWDNTDAPNHFWPGQLADVSIWDVELTNEEARALANGYVAPVNLRPNALKGYWPFDTDSNKDASGNGVDLVTVGAVPNVPFTPPHVTYINTLEIISTPPVEDAATVRITLTPSAVEAFASQDSATPRITITPSGSDVAAYVETATVLVAIRVGYCETFIVKPTPFYVSTHANKWTTTYNARWTSVSAAKWQSVTENVFRPADTYCLVV